MPALRSRATMPMGPGNASSSDEQAARPERHHQNEAGHQAPETRNHGGQKDELEALAGRTFAQQRVAHDEERRRQDEQADRSEGRRAGSAREKVETRQAAGGEAIARTDQAGGRKAE